jgi:hypothetical protein
MGRATRWVCENVAQIVAQPVFRKILYIILNVDKSSPKSLFWHFQKNTQRKQSPVGEYSPNLVTLLMLYEVIQDYIRCGDEQFNSLLMSTYYKFYISFIAESE